MRDFRFSYDDAVFRLQDRPCPYLDDVFSHRVDQQDAPILVCKRVQLAGEQVKADESVDPLGKLGRLSECRGSGSHSRKPWNSTSPP